MDWDSRNGPTDPGPGQTHSLGSEWGSSSIRVGEGGGLTNKEVGWVGGVGIILNTGQRATGLTRIRANGATADPQIWSLLGRPFTLYF